MHCQRHISSWIRWYLFEVVHVDLLKLGEFDWRRKYRLNFVPAIWNEQKYLILLVVGVIYYYVGLPSTCNCLGPLGWHWTRHDHTTEAQFFKDLVATILILICRHTTTWFSRLIATLLSSWPYMFWTPD
jgi:hypothetical protein